MINCFYLYSPLRWVRCIDVQRGLGGIVAITYLGEEIRGLHERRVGMSIILERKIK